MAAIFKLSIPSPCLQPKDWDCLANISASIDILDQVQQNIAISLKAPYSRTTHTTPNTSAVVWTVANKAHELKLNTFHADHEGNDNSPVQS
jgi:hypothetical protein